MTARWRQPDAAPSRDDNPFATCWTRPGRLGWLPASGACPQAILDRLEACRWGQIVGPHGVGKSTLLEAVAERLAARGAEVHRWTLNGSGDRSPQPRIGRRGVLLLDGLEQLSHWRRVAVFASCRWRGAGLIVTSHVAARLPILAELRPSLPDAFRLFELLTDHRPSPVTRGDVAASYHRHHGNIREVWFDLYDRHERLIRGRRTAEPGIA